MAGAKVPVTAQTGPYFPVLSFAPVILLPLPPISIRSTWLRLAQDCVAGIAANGEYCVGTVCCACAVMDKKLHNSSAIIRLTCAMARFAVGCSVSADMDDSSFFFVAGSIAPRTGTDQSARNGTATIPGPKKTKFARIF